MIQKRIAIDFGTICKDKFPEIGELEEGAKEVIQRFKEKGWYIIIYSCRSNSDYFDDNEKYETEMIQFLKDNNILYDEIYRDKGKVVADYYICDRAIEYKNNWKEIEMRII